MMMRCGIVILWSALALAAPKPTVLVVSDSGDIVETLRASGMFAVETQYSEPLSKFSAIVVASANPPRTLGDSLPAFVQAGGGLVIANEGSTAFPNSVEYNTMLGVSGFGGRDSKYGPLWFFENGKKAMRDVPGPAGLRSDAPEPFQVLVRAPDHPIMHGLPQLWTQEDDIQWKKLRGPGQRMTILATAFSLETQQDEIALLAVQFGKGRVFHSLLGHTEKARAGAPFQTLLLRGVEWAATGRVTTKNVPAFPPGDPKELRTRK